MPTRQPLRQMLPEIMQHIYLHREYLEYNNRLFLVHEGQLRKEIEDSMRAELSPASYQKAIKRVPSINLLVRIIDKLSRVYSEPVLRTVASPADQELIEQYEDYTCLSEKLASANKMYNLHKSVAIEPFVQDGRPYLRVLPAHQFLVFSDDPVNPLRPTVFIKFMGRAQSVPFTDRDGKKVQTNETREVQAYHLWSDSEFLVIDSEGRARDDIMQDRELDGSNPYGVIPFVYVNRSDFRLIPLPDTDTLENTVLIPKLLADLNYAVQFQSHSILVATDMDLPSDLALAPDTVWSLTSTDETKQGRLDAIKPSIDIEQVIGLIKTTLSIWLEARNIRAGDMGQVSPGDAASGVARVIDESDATQDRQSQIGRFRDAERALWSLIAEMHNYWVSAGLVEEAPGTFSPELDVTVTFGEQKPVVTDSERIANVKEQMELGLMTKRQALEALRPQFNKEQIETWLNEIEEASAKGSSALNGAQVSSIVELMTQAGQGMIPKSSVKAIIKVAFGIAEEAAQSIVAGLSDEPKLAAQATASGPDGQGNPAADGGSPKGNDSGADAGAGAGSQKPGQSDKQASPAKP